MKTELLDLNTAEPERADLEPGATLLPPPADLRASIPANGFVKERVSRARGSIERILEGVDDQRLLILCGPCSIHDTNAALEYASRLKALADRVADEILLVMRVYFEKPRSVVGWKGLVYDPDLAGSPAGLNGLGIARRLLVRINEFGMSCATEFLNPIVAPYIHDLMAYGSIGARTVESQIHREMAAGMTLPIGMKNNLEGDLRSAVNAVVASNQPHSSFATDSFGRPCIARSAGNPYAHVFMRGGRSGPNCDAASIAQACEALREHPLERPIMVDCSHANSGKDFRRQAANARNVAQLYCQGRTEIAGLMLESNLSEGNQSFFPGESHDSERSLTDGCIGWDETERVIEEIARSLKSRPV